MQVQEKATSHVESYFAKPNFDSEASTSGQLLMPTSTIDCFRKHGGGEFSNR